MHSNKSSGSFYINKWEILKFKKFYQSKKNNNEYSITRFGCHKTSHIPYNCSFDVPITAKSSTTQAWPIKSQTLINVSPVFGSKPATIGSTKYGPKLKSI